MIDRPFVVTPVGVRLCRPSELVIDILPVPQRRAFKELLHLFSTQKELESND